MQPTVLCIAMTADRVMRLSFAAMKLGILLRPVAEESWGQPLSALCGLSDPLSHPPQVRVGGEMMVMAFFSDELLEQWLFEIRKSGLAPVRLKAVLTEHNRLWNCGILYAALNQEAALMTKPRGNNK